MSLSGQKGRKMKNNCIEAKNLMFHYGRKHRPDDFFINDVSLKLEPGYISCLLGNNGAGKTTLMSLLYGFLRPKSGEILWNGAPLTKDKKVDFRREIAVSSNSWCSDDMTVRQNIEMLSVLYPSFDNEHFEKLMKLSGMEQSYDKIYNTLSTGEKVKTQLSFLLARKPKYLLLDEPLANIDPVFKIDILDLLQQEVAENEVGILISTHLIDEISDMVDYVYVLDKGQLVKSGTRFDVLGEGDLRDLFQANKKMPAHFL